MKPKIAARDLEVNPQLGNIESPGDQALKGDACLHQAASTSRSGGPLAAEISPAQDIALEFAGGPVAPNRVNDHGCQVFLDESAKQKLLEWGYPWMSGSRYPFDEHLKGWEQFDTPQDASYYGVWTSVDRMAVLRFAEGDVTLSVAPDQPSFQAEVRSLWDWNRSYKPDSSVHTQLDSPKLQAACLAGHPPFDKVLAEYKERVTLGRRYEALHEMAFATLFRGSKLE